MSKFFNFFKSLSNKFVFNLISGLTVGLSVGVIVLAFNNPVGNPPAGTGAIIGIGSGAPANSLYVDSTGKVGIGTAVPGYKLDIQTPNNYDQLRVRSTGASGEPLIKLSGGYNGGNGAEIWQDISGSFKINTNLTTTAMTILAAGNVGIGKTPGSYAFDVNGNVNATAYYGSGSNLTGIIGSRVARAASTAYQANTDGYVNGFVVAANGIATITGYSDSGNPPTTIIDKDGYWAGGGGDVGASVGFFVKKNDYWRVVVSSSGYPQTITVWWTPLGS